MDLLQAHFAHPLEAVQGRRPLDAASVHAIRKALKRARAGLRLVRDAVGAHPYAEENTRLRDAARLLAPAREARVAIDTIDALRERKGMHEHRATLLRLRAALRSEKHDAPVEPLREALQQSSARVSRWRLPRDPWPILSAGVERIYRRGRKAFAAARAQPADRALHELRKQVKYLGAAMEILGAAQAPRLRKLARRADAIAEPLGADHDLALLRRRFGRADRALLEGIDRRRGKLQRKALKKAARLYRCKPARFVERLERCPPSLSS